MKHYLVAGRYARGLSESITGLSELETAARVMLRLRQLYREHHALQNLFASPTILLERRQQVLHEILEREGAPQEVRRLLMLLLRRGRITYLPDVAEAFVALADQRLGHVRASVITAVPLDAAQEARLRRAFETHTGKQVHIDAQVDPAILGGVVARIGSIMIDGSVLARLKRLREALLTEEHVA